MITNIPRVFFIGFNFVFGSLPYRLGALRFGNDNRQFVLRISRRSIHQISIWIFVNEQLQNDYDVEAIR
ncbi:hypothetical protein RCL_jg20665.t1 [Rhizophagus clarus]|uniref:Uncharacterized protein n=1 Tax=Rhizophagus clarus TaxID=94130 RepID=A0A8H3QPI9_9GLOM|nr:hypothetical protein RCL_jg20665.t1 [Rhizophagus clarus]